MTLAPVRRRPELALPPQSGWARRLREGASGRDALQALLVLALASGVLRVVLATVAYAPVIFSDELGYEKLAQSIGTTGHLALFGHRGLSYSPLYPALLSPIFAAGASAPTAYALIKVVNAFLISLSVFPTYGIARFVLARRQALVVAAVSAAAPLLFYSSFSMSENLAYPVCLGALWAALVAIRDPRPRNDAAVLVAMAVAAATRAQLVVLVPAVLLAVVLVAVLGRAPGETGMRALVAAAVHHRLLTGAIGGAALAAGAAGLAGVGVYSIFGRYAEAGRDGLPSLGSFLDQLVRHLAGLDLGVGVVPFVAAIVCATAFARGRLHGRALPFAALALSTTACLLVEIALDAAIFDGSDIPRIHERFLIYLFPFFLVALFRTVDLAGGRAGTPVYVAAGAVAALLPLAIPFHTLVNQPSAVDSFGLQPLAHTHDGRVVAIPHAAVAAVGGAAILALLYLSARRRTRSVVILVLIPLVLISGSVLSRVSAGSRYARSLLPARSNWVDQAAPHGSVVLLTAAGDPLAALETAYGNLSIRRLYYLCQPAAGAEFGERQATVDAAGRLLDPDGPIAATYAVAPARLGIRGRIVARNPNGREVMVAARGGRLSIPRARRRSVLDCRA